MNMMKKIVGTATVVLLSGCLAGEAGNSENPDITVEVIPSSPVKVASYFLREEDGKLAVSGRVTSLNPIRRPGHVDLTVFSQEGTIAGRYQSDLFAYASKRGGVKEGRFVASISPVPIAGSKITLHYDQ